MQQETALLKHILAGGKERDRNTRWDSNQYCMIGSLTLFIGK